MSTVAVTALPRLAECMFCNRSVPLNLFSSSAPLEEQLMPQDRLPSLPPRARTPSQVPVHALMFFA